jgi:predicted ATPase
MIHSIKFKNYKAFESGEIKVKPLTILLGANSVGKSSLMQLFLMLQQTVQTDKNYKSALKLHGGFTSMGEGLNLIRKKNKNNILTISLSITDKKIRAGLSHDLKYRFLSDFMQFADMVNRRERLENERKSNKIVVAKKPDQLYIEIEDHIRFRYMDIDHKRQKNASIENETFESLINSTASILSKNNYDKFPDFTERYNLYGYELSSYLQIKERKQEFILLKTFLDELSKNIHSDEFIVEWELQSVEKALEIKSFSISNNEKLIIKVQFTKFTDITIPNYDLQSDIFDFTIFNRASRFKRNSIFSHNRPIFNFCNETEEDVVSPSELGITELYLKRICLPILKSAAGNFDQQYINYVSPLRASPKRYYFLDKARSNTSLDTLDGDAIADILKDKSAIKTRVNLWLKKFNLKIDISHLEDIIHKVTVSQNSLELDITDVGFGISQVLPVIIQGFLSRANSLTLIEQPEIHLHPKMQADLADLFIDIITPIGKRKPAKYLLIETHSEYLLKRIRRRMAEGTLNPDDVAIYLIDPEEHKHSATIKELEIESKGAFEWPKDFYSDELLKDTVQFLKLQN